MKKLSNLIGLFAIICCSLPAALAAQSFLPFYQGNAGSLVLERTIGGVIDDTDNFFYQPTDIVLDSKGNLFVLDYKGYCIKKFDPNGTHLVTFGSKGEGPGEMIGAYRMAIDPAGNIAIFDAMNGRRFSFYDNQGAFLRSVSLTELGYRNITDFDIGPGGEVYVRIYAPDYARPDGQSLVSVARFDLETRREETVDSLYVRDTYIRTHDRSMQMASAPYHPDLLWGIAPSGNIITADSDTYRIRVYSPDLTLLSERKNKGTERKITSKDKSDYFDSFEDEETAAWLRRSVEFPERKPWFDRMFIDHEGYILLWVDDMGDDTYGRPQAVLSGQ